METRVVEFLPASVIRHNSEAAAHAHAAGMTASQRRRKYGPYFRTEPVKLGSNETFWTISTRMADGQPWD